MTENTSVTTAIVVWFGKECRCRDDDPYLDWLQMQLDSAMYRLMYTEEDE